MENSPLPEKRAVLFDEMKNDAFQDKIKDFSTPIFLHYLCQ